MATVDTTLSTALTVRSTQVTLAAYTAPVGGFGARILLLVNNAETMEVLSSIGRTLTVQRGFNGTTALVHAAGVTVTYGLSTEMTGPSVVEGPTGPQAVIDSASVDWTFSGGTGSASGSGSSILHQATVILTNAQVKALKATPVTLVSGSSGLIYFLQSASFNLHVVTPYTNAGTGHAVVYIGASVGAASFSIATSSAFITATSDDIYLSSGVTSDDAVTNVSGVGIAIGNDGSVEIAAGDASNTLTVTVTYLTLNATTGVFV